MASVKLASEHLLIQRLHAREERAMTLFYTQYHRALYYFIWRVVRHNELAEDILQESLLKIWLSFATYDTSKGRLFTWALNISRNLAIDRLRERRHQEARRTVSLAEEAEQLAAAAAFQPEHIGVRDWLTLLPNNDRELIELLYFNGHTQVEASECLQLPLGTVKSRVKRIIKTLARTVN